jgi:S-adenosylmethionine-diacylglycerol 3-amino-3-carboxypropyl transferase
MNYHGAQVSFQYFNRLNYSLANEDTRLEVEVLPSNVSNAVAVAGSGSRVLPLLSKKPKILTIVDLSQSQLALTELRVETLRDLDYEEFVQFWYPSTQEFPATPLRQWRLERFAGLRLKPESRDYLRRCFEKQGWESLIHQGKWEKTFIFFSKLAKLILGKPVIEKLFSFRELEDQIQYFENEFPRKRFRLLLAIVGNARTFNALLYRGGFPLNNTGMHYVDYYEGAFERLFRNGLACENFFLQLTLLGSLKFRAALPIEADPVMFNRSKSALSDSEIKYFSGDLVGFLRASSSVDFVSFSNVPSYFTGPLEQSFLSTIRPALSDDATVVMRHYLHHPEGLDRTGYRDVTGEFRSWIWSEKIQMYTPEILKKEPL